MEMTNGWNESAAAWIAVMGEDGDFSRKHVLDKPMMERIRAGNFKSALDVGCGEGRFSRMLKAAGIQTVGIDPTEILIEEARRRDPAGDYRLAAAEELPFSDTAFDLVVSYLSLIDIPDAPKAISEMSRVLIPGGRLLIANLTSLGTAGDGWSDEPEPRFCIDRYLEIRELLSEWKGIRVTNWHRPLSYYMKLLLSEDLVLRYFDEPPAHGGDPVTAAKYQRVPWLMMMEWEKV
jgi:SAM-dependent methyltransferase